MVDPVSGDEMPVSGEDKPAPPPPEPEIPIALQCCKNCFNWAISEVEGMGQCCFNPPVIDPRIMTGTLTPSMHGRLASIYPQVKGFWWCSKWVRQEVGTPNSTRRNQIF
jgi:hypothetical protein